MLAVSTASVCIQATEIKEIPFAVKSQVRQSMPESIPEILMKERLSCPDLLKKIQSSKKNSNKIRKPRSLPLHLTDLRTFLC